MNIQINRHTRDFGKQTIEFEVKNPTLPTCLGEEILQYEFETGAFTNKYGQKCFDEIMKSNYTWVDDWSFAGRSNGWFALIIKDGYFVDDVRQKSIDRIERIIEKYFNEYGEKLEEFYTK